MSQFKSSTFICAECGTEFPALVGNAKYCTSRCRYRAERHRKAIRDAARTAVEDARLACSVQDPSVDEMNKMVVVAEYSKKPVQVLGQVPEGWTAPPNFELIKPFDSNFHLLVYTLSDVAKRKTSPVLVGQPTIAQQVERQRAEELTREERMLQQIEDGQ